MGPESLEQRHMLASGATEPWTRYQAEAGTIGQAAAVVGPDRTVGNLAAEASGRMAVRLATSGDFVEWPVLVAANALVIRLSIPDAAQGGGIDSTISVYRNGTFLQAVPVTSRYSWVYGNDDAVTNDPASGTPRRMYDESNALLSEAFAPGDTIRVQKQAVDTAASYTIDFIELENVAANARPPNTIAITEKGAVANDSGDDTAAIVAAIADAKSTGKMVWIPSGQFHQSAAIAAGGVTVLGAGMWFSELWGYNPNGNNAVGFNVTGGNTVFRDFRIRGEQAIRAPTSWNVSAFFGAFGTGSEIHDVWIERVQCGAWVGVDNTTNPATNLVFDGLRIRNTFADGVNLCNGTVNSTVSNCTARNTGDDAFAAWSAPAAPRANSGNVFRDNTAECIWKAAGFAVYGGADTRIERNLVADTLTYSGITVASSFSSRAFQGTTLVRGNTLLRCGGVAWGQEHGAVWVYVDDSTIAAPVAIESNLVVDATYTAFEINASNRGNAVTGPLTFAGNTVLGATGVVNVTYYAKGAATFSDTRLARVAPSALVRNDSQGNFAATITGTTTAAGPTVATPVGMVAGPDPARTAGLTVLGGSIAGESMIRYDWSATGPGDVVFSASGTNAAASTIARFARAGSYVLTATMTDPTGLSVASSVTQVVVAVLSGIGVSSPSATLLTEESEQFVARGLDQFGATLDMPSRVGWAADRGTISVDGLYAVPTLAGQVTVTATAAGFSGSIVKPIDAFSVRRDIGAVGRIGSDSFSPATSTYEVTGAGADIWYAADGFRSVSRAVSGDATLVVRVAAQTATDPWAKSGVMIREGSAADARFAAVLVTPSNGVAFQWRTAAGENALSVEAVGVTAPRWVKLVRSADAFSAFQSSDGVTWSPIGATRTVPMGTAVSAGLAVTAHNNSLLSTARFTNVSLVTSASLAPAVFRVDVTTGSLTQEAAGFLAFPGSTPVVKTGGGTLVLDRANPLAESFGVRDGTTQLAHPEALAAATVVVEPGAAIHIVAGQATHVARLVLGGRCDVGTGRITVAGGLSAVDVVQSIVAGRGTGGWDGRAGFTSAAASADGERFGIGWLDNGDGSFTVAHAAPGDTNLDGVLDLLDVARLISSGTYGVSEVSSWAEGDFNYDGTFDIIDVAGLIGTALFNEGDYLWTGQPPSGPLAVGGVQEYQGMAAPEGDGRTGTTSMELAFMALAADDQPSTARAAKKRSVCIQSP